VTLTANNMKATAAVSLGFLSACLFWSQADDEPADPIDWEECSGQAGDHPCNIVSFDQDNQPFDLYKFYGQPIVIDLSAMWCSPCASAADEAQSVQDAYADKGLVYITVLVENTKREEPTVSDLQAWAETFGNVTTPVVAGARSMLESSGDGTWTVEGWPTFYYIDRKMVTRDIDRGFSSEEVALSIEWLLSLDKPEE
jgi:thiol-disulfide isomerase/thioredoxin